MLLRLAIRKALKLPLHFDRCFVCGKKLEPIMIYLECSVCHMPFCTNHYDRLKNLPECPVCGSKHWN